jgi:putative hemolysin
MLATTQKLNSTLIRSGNLEVGLATGLQDLDAALRLRFEVFNLELQEGLLSSYDRGYDMDAYDAYCDHLIVRDLELDRVVGTYRLLRQSVAARQIGFYSENEFDLTRLKQTAAATGELLELGRSCIAFSHRSFTTINLLWAAIARYAQVNGISLLFGCGSLHVSDPEDVGPLYRYLRERHLAPEKYRVAPVEACRMALEETSERDEEARHLSRRLSPILRGYLRTGALICGEPAYDREFGTADVLVLLEMDHLAHRYRHHYGIEE